MPAPQLHSVVVSTRGVFVHHPGMAAAGSAGSAFLDSCRPNWRSGPATRGRPYASKGSILSLEFGIGIVSALVAGSGYEYQTLITGVLPDLSGQGPVKPAGRGEPQGQGVIKPVAGGGKPAGKGFVKSTGQGAFKPAGPVRPSASCTCAYGSRPRDWCKHAIAVAFATAALLDGAVDDHTGKLVPRLAAPERPALEAAALRLLDEPDWTEFDPDAEFARASRWLPFPRSAD